MFKEFITALQFLTRIHILQQNDIKPQVFGQSVKFFPLVGAVIGVILFSMNYFMAGRFPLSLLAVLLLAGEVVITGGLHVDGLMDTMDGVFSGQPRQRMLEIMRDSRVGAYGVMAFGIHLLLKYSLLMELLRYNIGLALFIMPVLGRFAMVIAITAFPYARPEGLGKAFVVFSGRKSLLWAAIITFALVLPWGYTAIASIIVVSFTALVFCRYITKLLGGLTGDVYGTMTELSETLVLALYLLYK